MEVAKARAYSCQIAILPADAPAAGDPCLATEAENNMLSTDVC